jgi:hypothetical protein
LGKVCAKLLRQDRRNARVYALPHFHLWHDQRHLAGLVDADICVRNELFRWILCLGRLGGAKGEMEGEHEPRCQCATEKATSRDLWQFDRDSHDATYDL